MDSLSSVIYGDDNGNDGNDGGGGGGGEEEDVWGVRSGPYKACVTDIVSSSTDPMLNLVFSVVPDFG